MCRHAIGASREAPLYRALRFTRFVWAKIPAVLSHVPIDEVPDAQRRGNKTDRTDVHVADQDHAFRPEVASGENIEAQ